MAASNASVPAATYDLIQTWIGQQRQMPVPLTEELRNAILNLESALKTVMPVVQAEPELGESNWIGMLLEYRAAHPFSGSREVGFAESSLDPSGRGNLRFQCQVTLPEAPGAVFPGVGGGLHTDGSQPSFARKKDAKKYAAKCAVEWLRAKGFMPQEGGVRFPKATIAQPPPSPSQTRQLGASGSSPPVRNGRGGGREGGRQAAPFGQTTHPSTTSTTTSITPTSPFDDTEPAATRQVSQLCDSLGLSPPAYRLQAVESGGQFWSGHADFGVHSVTLPFDAARLVRVKNVFGKRTAREMIAEDLLTHLREEKRTREIGDHAFLARIRGGGGEGPGEKGGMLEG